MVDRLLPRQFDNRFDGKRLALWLLGMLLALKLVIGVNSLLNTESVAAGADKFPLASYGADGASAVLMLFALHALAGLMLTLVGILALVRYRAMVPLVFVLLIVEQIARRLIVQGYAIERSEPTSAAVIVNMTLLGMLLLGLALSLWSRRRTAAP